MKRFVFFTLVLFLKLNLSFLQSQFYIGAGTGFTIRQKFKILETENVKIIYPNINSMIKFELGYNTNKMATSMGLSYYHTSYHFQYSPYTGNPPNILILSPGVEGGGKGFAFSIHPRLGAIVKTNNSKWKIIETIGLNLMLKQGIRRMYNNGQYASFSIDKSGILNYGNYGSIQNKALTLTSEIIYNKHKWAFFGTCEMQYKFNIFNRQRGDRVNSGHVSSYAVWENDVFQFLGVFGVRFYLKIKN